MSDLDGKVAIITGAGRGLGREEAIQLAKQGARVVISDIDLCRRMEHLNDQRFVVGRVRLGLEGGVHHRVLVRLIVAAHAEVEAVVVVDITVGSGAGLRSINAFAESTRRHRVAGAGEARRVRK